MKAGIAHWRFVVFAGLAAGGCTHMETTSGPYVNEAGIRQLRGSLDEYGRQTASPYGSNPAFRQFDHDRPWDASGGFNDPASGFGGMTDIAGYRWGTHFSNSRP